MVSFSHDCEYDGLSGKLPGSQRFLDVGAVADVRETPDNLHLGLMCMVLVASIIPTHSQLLD